VTTQPATALEQTVADVTSRTPTVEWSVMVRDAAGVPLAKHESDRPLATASIGKLLLLIETARRLATGELTVLQLVSRRDAIKVTDSGLWQHLLVDDLPVSDVATLIASVSDNLATNVLLDVVGLAALEQSAQDLQLTHTRLHDYVRDERRPEDPPRLSTGTAGELSDLMHQLGQRNVVDVPTSTCVLDWLACSTDLSMVASAFGLDPLAHVGPDRGITLWNKTGTNDGVRADVGFVEGRKVSLTYAVIANWNPSTWDARDAVLVGMRSIGESIRGAVNS